MLQVAESYFNRRVYSEKRVSELKSVEEQFKRCCIAQKALDTYQLSVLRNHSKAAQKKVYNSYSDCKREHGMKRWSVFQGSGPLAMGSGAALLDIMHTCHAIVHRHSLPLFAGKRMPKKVLNEEKKNRLDQQRKQQQNQQRRQREALESKLQEAERKVQRLQGQAEEERGAHEPESDSDEECSSEEAGESVNMPDLKEVYSHYY